MEKVKEFNKKYSIKDQTEEKETETHVESEFLKNNFGSKEAVIKIKYNFDQYFNFN